MTALPSYWINDSYHQFFDFLVLGNGFTGMQTAIQLKLKHPKAKIAIADKNYISDGASLRNAGFACFGSVSEILDDIASTNKEEVLNLVQMRYRGLQYLTEDFKHFDYHQGNAQEVFLPQENKQYEKCLEQLEDVNADMAQITGQTRTYKENKHPFLLHFLPKAIVNDLEGHLHSGKLYHQMQQKVIGLGIFWIANFEIVDINHGNEIELISKSNLKLRSKVVVSCLNAFTKTLISDAPVVPARGQIIVTSKIKNNPLTGILHADKGYIYARNLGDNILIGGGRNIDPKTEETFEFDTNEKITQYLLDFVNEKLLTDEQVKIEETWSCIMGMSPNKGGLPIIKEEQANFWTCYRLGGMGVALSSVIARKMAEQL